MQYTDKIIHYYTIFFIFFGTAIEVFLDINL
jgi:hypothetical protein